MYHFLELRRRFPNPMTAIPRPKVERMVQKTLEISQLRQLLALPLAPRDRAIILLLIDCGPRAGEICSVTRENVKERSIVINGKTGQVEVPISPATHDLLVQLAPSGPLFWGPKGVLNRDGIYKLVRKCLAQIGDTQGKRGPHMLRHTMGRQYMEGGGDLLSLQQILGHTQIDTTAHYGAMSKEGIAARHALATPLKRVLPGVEPLMAHCKKCHKPAMVDGLRLPITRCLHCQVVGQWDIDGAPGSTARSAVADPRPVQAPLTLTSRDLDTELAGRGEAHA
jgi:integrase